MSNRSADALFQLIKSLGKGEKRNFKLFVNRNSVHADLKVIQVFDAMDKMKDYNDAQLLKKNSSIKKQQLSNIKAQLYKQILASLRLISDENNIDIQLHDQMAHARILYNKGLYLQCLKILDKMKETAKTHHQLTNLQQVLFFEKKIEALFITRSMKNRADQLKQQSEKVNQQLIAVNRLSNLSLQLYSLFIQRGHVRNEKEMDDLKLFFEKNLPVNPIPESSFYEKLYLYQSYCWYAFIRLDFLMYYRYAQKWVDLFDEEPVMISVETASYIKGVHNLMGAHFNLLNHDKLNETIEKFEEFTHTKIITDNENNRILTSVYLYTAKLNLSFLQGEFTEGLKLLPLLENMLKENDLYLDSHRVLIFYYKIACLYFGSGDNERAIDYLHKIINQKSNLRTDLQCYARLLQLIAHYELGNFELLEYLTKSVYRFMAKMENLSKVEEAIFKFLQKTFRVGAHALKPEFVNLLDKLKIYKNNPLETRSFTYLDVISWLESKIDQVHVQDIIKDKFLLKKKRN